jgi:elongation factor Ts
MKAAKKAGRTAAEGIVLPYRRRRQLWRAVEVNSETDFVARDDNFLGFVGKVVDAGSCSRTGDVAATDGRSLEAAARGAGPEDWREHQRAPGGERMVSSAALTVGSYVHSNNKIAVLVACAAAIRSWHATSPCMWRRHQSAGRRRPTCPRK